MPVFNKVDIETEAEFIDLVPLGDIHFGNEVFTKDGLDKLRGYIKWIMERPGAFTILMGDIIESANIRGVYEMKQTPQEQMETAVAEFKELAEAGKILGSHSGNHEHWIKRDRGFDIAKIMAKDLKVKYLEDAAFHKVRVNEQNYHVYSTHGAGNATTPSGKIQKLVQMRQSNAFDVGLKGHMHTKSSIMQWTIAAASSHSASAS